jgi:hypothetical protein
VVVTNTRSPYMYLSCGKLCCGDADGVAEVRLDESGGWSREAEGRVTCWRSVTLLEKHVLNRSQRGAGWCWLGAAYDTLRMGFGTYALSLVRWRRAGLRETHGIERESANRRRQMQQWPALVSKDSQKRC